MSSEFSMAVAAMELAEQGFPVIMLRPNEKIPFGKWSPGEYNEPTKDKQTIACRWGAKGANIGIACGLPMWSGFLAVLDIDPKSGGERPDWAVATASVRTASGGEHHYYITERPVKNSAGLIAPGVDVRGRGGQVVAPPSVIGGEQYAWIDSASIANLPAALFESQIRPTDSLSSVSEQGSPPSARPSFDPSVEVIRQGQRDDYLARYAGWYINRLDPVHDDVEAELYLALVAENTRIVSPSLPSRDLARIAMSINKAQEREYDRPI